LLYYNETINIVTWRLRVANMKPEEKARQRISQLLNEPRWVVRDVQDLNLGAALGVAIRAFPLESGSADYLLFVEREAVGVVEAKTEGATVSGVADQSGRYMASLPKTSLIYKNLSPMPMKAQA
jgi:type I restriction enzyme R subunit